MNQFECLERRRLLAAGDPDVSFGTAGSVEEPITSRIQYNDTIILPDDKIFLAGSYAGKDNGSAVQYILSRYGADGRPDRTFCEKGNAFGSLDGVTNAGISKITVESNGQFLAIAGYAGLVDSQLVRFNADGSVDSSFGKEGAMDLGFAAAAVTEQGDGKIVVAGNHGVDFDAARFNADGSPDKSFGDNGISVDGNQEIAGLLSTVTALSVLPSGRILLGTDDIQVGFQLIMLNPDGSLDSDFGSGGTSGFNEGDTIDPEPSAVEQIAVLGNGKILAAGEGIGGLAIVRFNADGSVDKTFGSPGLEIDLSQDSAHLARMGIDSAGNIVLIGNSARTVDVVRVTPNGALDKTFGEVEAFLADQGFIGAGGAIQSNGKIVIAGVDLVRSSGPPVANALLERLMASGSAPSPITLDASGHVLTVTGTGINDTIIVSDGVPVAAIENNFGRVFDASAVQLVSVAGGAGDDRIAMDLDSIPAEVNGGDGADRISGGNKNDTLSGGAGADRIDGGSGADHIEGDGGNDRLRGQGGADLIHGGTGNDYIEGDGGNDRIDGGAGIDVIHGDRGNDTIFASDGQADSIFGDGGGDTAYRDTLDVLQSIETRF